MSIINMLWIMSFTMAFSCRKKEVKVQIAYDGNAQTQGSAPIDPSEYKEGDSAIVLDNTAELVKTNAL
jgi:hypothetical protein